MFISLFRAVFILVLMIAPGFIMRKAKLASDSLPLGFTNTILYITQPALIVVGFFRARDMEILKNAAIVLVLSFITHVLFLLAVKLFFRHAEKAVQKVYRFGVAFSNAGYMGIPLITMALPDVPEAAIYASVYIVAFNFFCWSFGALIYSEDKSYISPKKMLVNAATIPTAIGILIFVTNAYSYIPAPVADFTEEVLVMLKNTVAPMSMMIIGMRLADLEWKGAFKDKYLYEGLFLRLILFPLGVFGILALCKLCGIYSEIPFTVVMISSATPVATATCMFAEKFGCDSKSASKFVSISTLLSLATMPLMVLLLELL